MTSTSTTVRTAGNIGNQKGIIPLGYNPGGVQNTPLQPSGKLDVPTPQMGAPLAPKTSTSPFSGGLSGIYNMPKSTAPAGPNAAFGSSGLGGLPGLNLPGTTPSSFNASSQTNVPSLPMPTGGGTPMNGGRSLQSGGQMDNSGVIKPAVPPAPAVATTPAPTGPTVPPPVDAGANTYNNGVNANGQTLAGYVPPSATPPPPTQQQQNYQALTNQASQPTPQYNAGQAQYDTANAQLQALKSNTTNYNLADWGSNASDYAGVQGMLNANLSAKESSLANEMSAAQTSAQVATGQQSAQMTGLSNAGGLIKLQPGQQYGTYSTDPSTGLQVGGSGNSGGTLNPLNNIQSIAQQVINHQISPSQAYAMGGNVQNFQAALNQELQKQQPGFNAAQAEGAYSAQSSNTQTAGTASTAANQGVYNTAMANMANVQNMASNIKSFGDQAISNISSLPLTPLAKGNATIQWAAQQANDPAFAQFNANIQGLQARVSALLGTGEIPSSATAGAQAIINGTLNLNALQSTMDQINKEADAIVSNAGAQATKAYQNIQSNSGGSNSGSSSYSGTPTFGKINN
jgi:hypothetical protein